MRIVICDVGLGNLRSVERAVARAARAKGGTREGGVDVEVTADPDRLRTADKLVMPGQGAFGDCARALAKGLGEALKEGIARGVPYLGICLGLQVLFAGSEEAPGVAGLGLFEGTVLRLRGGVDPTTGTPLKIPHVGWNVVEPTRSSALLPAEATHFYFVHSYAAVPREPAIVLATTEYGERFVSAVERDNVFACQFHPEKSQQAGLDLLARFARS